jgi:hypothetical protein
MKVARSITPEEAALIQWLLDHAAMTDVTAYRAEPPGELRVIGGCNCGCTSVDFQEDRRGAKIIADAVAFYSDGQRAGLILWGRDRAILSLEVYDFHPGASHRLPEIADLRTWEELGGQPRVEDIPAANGEVTAYNHRQCPKHLIPTSWPPR